MSWETEEGIESRAMSDILPANSQEGSANPGPSSNPDENSAGLSDSDSFFQSADTAEDEDSVAEETERSCTSCLADT